MFLGIVTSVVSQGLVWCIMALGVYLSYKILDFADLSVDGSIVTGAAVCSVLCLAGVPPIIACLISFVAGLICGMCTGLLHTAVGIPPILAGISMQFILYPVNLAIMGGATASIHTIESKISLADTQSTTLWMLVIVAVIIAVLYWFFGTQLGCSLRATGCNEHMARAQGINTNKTKVLCLMISNGLVALSGGLLALYQGSADATMGTGAIVIGLASVIIGGVVVSKLPSNFALKLVGVVLGAIIYFSAYRLAVALKLLDWLKAIASLVIIIFLAVPYFKQKYSKVKLPRELLEQGGNNNA